MNSTTSRSKASLWAVGLMLFALFFGAGNLIYPAYLGAAGQRKLAFGHVRLSADRGGFAIIGA